MEEEFEIKCFDDFINLYESPFSPVKTTEYTLDDMRNAYDAGRVQGFNEGQDSMLYEWVS